MKVLTEEQRRQLAVGLAREQSQQSNPDRIAFTEWLKAVLKEGMR